MRVLLFLLLLTVPVHAQMMMSEALKLSCENTFIKSGVSNLEFCSCFPKEFLTRKNVEAIRKATQMNNEIRDMFDVAAEACLVGKSDEVKDAAHGWIQNER